MFPFYDEKHGHASSPQGHAKTSLISWGRAGLACCIVGHARVIEYQAYPPYKLPHHFGDMLVGFPEKMSMPMANRSIRVTLVGPWPVRIRPLHFVID
jgi:hypothetical protein